MRNLLNYLTFLVLLLLIGSCQKDGNLGLQEEQTQNNLSISAVTENGTIVNQLDLQSEEFPQSREVSNMRAKNQAMVSGHFKTATSNSLYSFNVIGNRGGIHGQAEINSPTLGHAHGRVIGGCIGEGEGGVVFLVTNVRSDDSWFGLNDLIYFYVKDNGEGNNAPIDQHQTTITKLLNWALFYDTPEDALVDFPCGVTGYTGNYIDIATGQIQVK
ncbi:MAG: hypothetical protein HKN68_07785 [Saprospiraceae bacterium]|nr:hypothetical protein [Saprospiraceae bacterium]